MTIGAFPRLALIMVVGAVLLAGCPVPLPPMYDARSRQNVGDHIPEFIVYAQTTRDEILLRLGEPDGRGSGDRWFAYGSRYGNGGVVFVMAAGGGAGALGVESVRYRRLVIRFDDSGVVTGASFVQRDCPSFALAVGSQGEESRPCLDVTTDDAPQSVPMVEPGVPPGERVVAIYDNVTWAVTLHGLLNPERRLIPGTLTLTDRSLVFAGKRAAADGSPIVRRIPYADMTGAQSGLMHQILIQVAGKEYEAFEVRQAGAAPAESMANVDAPDFAEPPGRSIVEFLARKIGVR
jgi:hypothetical protein